MQELLLAPSDTCRWERFSQATLVFPVAVSLPAPAPRDVSSTVGRCLCAPVRSGGGGGGFLGTRRGRPKCACKETIRCRSVSAGEAARVPAAGAAETRAIPPPSLSVSLSVRVSLPVAGSAAVSINSPAVLSGLNFCLLSRSPCSAVTASSCVPSSADRINGHAVG